ncbi:MAG: hypothetical protein ACOC4I_06745 [Spirochaetota bacterium]
MNVLQDSSVAVRDGSDEITREQQDAKAQMENVSSVVESMESAVERASKTVLAISSSMQSLRNTIDNSSEQHGAVRDSILHLIRS